MHDLQQTWQIRTILFHLLFATLSEQRSKMEFFKDPFSGLSCSAFMLPLIMEYYSACYHIYADDTQLYSTVSPHDNVG